MAARTSCRGSSRRSGGISRTRGRRGAGGTITSRGGDDVWVSWPSQRHRSILVDAVVGHPGGSVGVCAAVAGDTMKVAVLGASGLIGRALVEQLNRDGHRVTAVSRKPLDEWGYRP